jgi:hypothetical protein
MRDPSPLAPTGQCERHLALPARASSVRRPGAQRETPAPWQSSSPGAPLRASGRCSVGRAAAAQFEIAAPPRSRQSPAGCSTRGSLLPRTTTSSNARRPDDIATRDCDSRRGIALALACASLRQRRCSSSLRCRARTADLVPMHWMRRVRPCGASVPFQVACAAGQGHTCIHARQRPFGRWCMGGSSSSAVTQSRGL